MREPISRKLRFQVLRRDRFSCRYCGAKAGDTKLHIDHRIPVKHGGKTVIANLYTACQPCNLGKGILPVDAVPVPHAVLMELKLLEGMAIALHGEAAMNWWDWLVNCYEIGGDLDDVKANFLEARRDKEDDLAHAYRGLDSNMNRPSYMRQAKQWVDDPAWRYGMSAEEIRYIKEWGTA